MKKQRILYTVILVLLVSFVGFLNITSTQIVTSERDSRKQEVFDTAVNLANPPSDAILVRFDKNYDYDHNGIVWFLDWKISNKLISVEVDGASLAILYYIDTSLKNQLKIYDVVENKQIVFEKAKQMLTSMESIGVQPLPNDACLLSIEKMNGEWAICWGHEINSVPIEYDEISLTLTEDCNQIRSYRKVWNTMNIDTNLLCHLKKPIGFCIRFVLLDLI
ncbi:MAG: hypothetical protein P1Q69_03615 [Candidatus Thorarchaeota archaeon]|nr:hypothetical protein [Candidatus Thorarchaeota archaeon]